MWNALQSRPVILAKSVLRGNVSPVGARPPHNVLWNTAVKTARANRGCTTDQDCYPGDRCDGETEQCVAQPCVDTQVDCGYREFCNTVSGECYDAGNLYCKPCDRDNEELDCGKDNLCFAGYCGVDCSEGKECPGGFDCYPFNDDSGNIVTWQCITYCWLYEDYDPGAFVQKPSIGPYASPRPGL